MSIERWVDKEVVIHIYNGISLNHKKECISVSFNEVDEPKDYYIEWSKSGSEKKYIIYECIYMESGRKYWWTHLQRNENADIEDGLMDTAGEGETRRNWDSSIDIYTLSRVKQITSGKLLYNIGSPALHPVMS